MVAKHIFPWNHFAPSQPGKVIGETDVALFQPLKIRGVTLKNRTVVSPMCTYSSVDGYATDWHTTHLTQFAIGGAALIFTEATAVEAIGRISPYCTGIWKDEHIAGWKRVTDSIHSHNALVGIQIGHAGRKASTYPPFYPKEMQRTAVPEDKEGWKVVGVTDEPFGSEYAVPRALTEKEIEESIKNFALAAKRSVEAGFDVIEIHGAHGYLISTFNSPLVNKRTDKYGGSFENRTRYLREVVKAVREVIPEDMPLFVRLSSVDGPADGWTIEDTVRISEILKKEGVDVTDCSSGGVVNSREGINPLGHYQVPYAAAVHNKGLKSMAVGLINEPISANNILKEGHADLIAIGRGFLHNPRWTNDAAKVLGVKVEPARQYRWTYRDLPPAQFDQIID